MSGKIVDGSATNYLMDAVEHFTRLEGEMTELRWRLCYRDVSATRLARKHCRKLIFALEMVDTCLWIAKEDAKEDEAAAGSKVVSIDEQRKKP